MDKGGDEESRDCIESSSSPSRSMGGCGDRALWVWPLRVDGEREGGKEEKEGWRCSDVGWPAREVLRLTPDSAMAPCVYLSNECQCQCPSRRHASSVGAKGGGDACFRHHAIHVRAVVRSHLGSARTCTVNCGTLGHVSVLAASRPAAQPSALRLPGKTREHAWSTPKHTASLATSPARLTPPRSHHPLRQEKNKHRQNGTFSFYPPRHGRQTKRNAV